MGQFLGKCSAESSLKVHHGKITPEHGSGQLFGGKPDKSNTYDNYMILRGALWAYHSHDLGSKTSVGSYELKRNSFGSARLSEPMNKTNAVRYGVTK